MISNLNDLEFVYGIFKVCNRNRNSLQECYQHLKFGNINQIEEEFNSIQFIDEFISKLKNLFFSLNCE